MGEVAESAVAASRGTVTFAIGGDSFAADAEVEALSTRLYKASGEIMMP